MKDLLEDVRAALTDIRHHAHVRYCPDCPRLIGDLMDRIQDALTDLPQK